jgi:hypothetical protein
MSMCGHGVLLWLCYDAHLDDLPIAGRTRARHSGYALLCRHKMHGRGSGSCP